MTYKPYLLRDNPFPATPLLDPSSDDDRVNGKIYNPHIREAEIRSFESKIRQQLPLIYIENSVFERGMGKSALLVQQWRQLQTKSDVTSIYVRSKESLKPGDFVVRLIERWHYEGHLWQVILQMLGDYVRTNSRREMPTAGYDLLREKLPRLPTRPISLANFNVYDSRLLINDLATMAYQHAGDHLNFDLAKAFFETYLTDPTKFLTAYPAALRRQKLDNIAMLAGIYRLLKLGGCHYHYLFFDQFENSIHGLTGKALISFNSEMRRLIEASIGQATITITLHPGAAQALATHEGGDIRSIAPHDSRYVVDVLPLSLEGALQLAQTYIDHFRLPDAAPSTALYPFTPEAVEEMHKASCGNIRACLQAFNYAIECGIAADYALVDRDFLRQHHSEITGRVHAEDIEL